MFIEDVPAADLLVDYEIDATPPAMGADWVISPDAFARAVCKLKTTEADLIEMLWAYRRAGDALAHAAGREQWAYADWKAAIDTFAAEREARTGYRMTQRQIRTCRENARAAWCAMWGVDNSEVRGVSVKVIR